MHPLVQMQHLTRKEFWRGLGGLSDEDARRRLEPMNCISWIVGHLAHQTHALFVALPQDKEIEPRYRPFGTGAAPSQPSLEEATGLWEDACRDADLHLKPATEASTRSFFDTRHDWGSSDNLGTLVVRNIFHTWQHLGEVNAIRQMLGHKAPEFVNMHGWSYATDDPHDLIGDPQ